MIIGNKIRGNKYSVFKFFFFLYYHFCSNRYIDNINSLKYQKPSMYETLNIDIFYPSLADGHERDVSAKPLSVK